MTNTIRYTLQTGSLPTGLTLNEATGKFEGSPTWQAVSEGPVFTTPVDPAVGTFNIGESVNYGPLEVTVASGRTYTMGMKYDGQGLPWGLVFDPDTRVISGTIATPTVTQAIQQDNVNGPTWNTQFGKVGDFDESGVANLTLSATPYSNRSMSRYTVVGGALPWGLVLSPAGVITGTVADLKNPGLTIETPKLPVPTWTTVAGTIAIVNEFEDLNVSLAASAISPRSIVKYTLRTGNLPWGITLNTVTGALTGNIKELILRGDLDYYMEPGKDPQISQTVTVNTVATTVAAMGSLGTFNKGSAVNIQFGITPYAGRTTARTFIALGVLPWGLVFSNAGIISGTVHATRAAAGTYTITVMTVDSAQASYSRTYTLTIQ